MGVYYLLDTHLLLWNILLVPFGLVHLDIFLQHQCKESIFLPGLGLVLGRDRCEANQEMVFQTAKQYPLPLQESQTMVRDRFIL
jgi:hypothetical protein